MNENEAIKAINTTIDRYLADEIAIGAAMGSIALICGREAAHRRNANTSTEGEK